MTDSIQDKLRNSSVPKGETNSEFAMRMVNERQEAANVIDGLERELSEAHALLSLWQKRLREMEEISERTEGRFAAARTFFAAVKGSEKL